MSERAEARRCVKCGEPLAASALGRVCSKCLAPLAFGAEVGEESGDNSPAESVSQASEGATRRVSGIAGLDGYELLEEIGRGGMGVVFKARQRKLNRMVAVKTILTGPLAGSIEAKRLRAEAQAAAQLQHPNIVAIHEIGEKEGTPYFSMEYVEGRSLANLLANGPLEARRAAGYLRIIATAIEYAHQHGILHRDLKPSNVLIDQFDQPRITDFGLAKRLTDSEFGTAGSRLTITGQVLGTPGFMPPEQAGADHGAIGPASDVYAMGALLYFLLTGRAPFSGTTLQATLAKVLGSEPEPLRKLNAKVPRDLETICLKCLAKEPRRRYSTANELADELDRFLRGDPILARPAGMVEKTWRWCRRYPAGASLVISLTITVAVVVALLAVLAGNRNPDNLSELWAVDATTFKIGEDHIGFGRDIGVDLNTGNYWAAILKPSTMSPAGVIVREGRNNIAVDNIPLADTNGFCPGGVRVDAIHHVVWVSAQCGNHNDPIWAIDAETHKRIKGPIGCGGVNGVGTVNPVTGVYYQDSSGPKRVDPKTFAVTRTEFGGVIGVNPSINIMYAESSPGILQIVNGATEVVLTNLSLPFRWPPVMGIDPDKNRVYLGDTETNLIHILDGTTGQILEAIAVEKSHARDARFVGGVTFDAEHSRLYAVVHGDKQRTSYLYRIEKNGAQRAIKIPPQASGPVLNPVFNKIYIWTGPNTVD